MAKEALAEILGIKLGPDRKGFCGIEADSLPELLSGLEESKRGKAKSLIFQGLRKNLRDGLLWQILGSIYLIEEKSEKSIKCFFRAIESNAINKCYWISLGLAYKSSGDNNTGNLILLKHKELAYQFLRSPEKLKNQVLLRIISEVNKKRQRKPRQPIILNLNANFASITGKQGRKVMIINPPIEEPFLKLKNKDKMSGSLKNSGFYHRKDNALYIRKSYMYNTPLGLLMIAKNLEEKGCQVVFLDCLASLPEAFLNSKWRLSDSGEKEKDISTNWMLKYFHLGMRYSEIKKAIWEIKPEEVWIGGMFTYHNKPVKKIVNICREAVPGIKVRIGGIYPTLALEDAKESKADEIFSGKYPGLREKGIDYEILGYNPGYMVIKGTSGCPNRCSYCAVHKIEGHKFKFREPDEVFHEIKNIHEKYGTTEVGIWDSNILLDYKNYLSRLLEKIISSDMKLCLSAPEGVDYRVMTQKIADDMKNAGFENVSLALENADLSFTSKHMTRKTDILKFRNAVQSLKTAGFKGKEIRVFIMIGMPGQTLQNVIQNIRFVWSLGCNVVLFPFTPIPGTGIYEKNRDSFSKLDLADLHPLLYPCVKDRGAMDFMIELNLLNLLNIENKLQKTNFREYLFSQKLISALEGQDSVLEKPAFEKNEWWAREN